MSLSEAFASLPVRRSGRPCATCLALRDMPSEDSVTLQGLIDGGESSAMIAEACRSAGFPTVSEGTLKRHRRGDCRGLT